MTGGRDALARPFRVEFPRVSPAAVEVPVHRLRTPARHAASVVLAVLMLVGIALAVTAAIAADGDETAAVGALGTELGAALWFAGAVAWGARRHATAARGLLLALTFVSGLVLIAAGLLLDWSGPALELTMEFGVGMLAIPVIDVILMGVLYDRLDTFGRGSGARVLTLQLGGDARPARLCWRDERLSR